MPYVARRLLLMVPVLFGITVMSYLIITLAPGNPVDLLIDPNMSEADRQARMEALGLNDPVYVQYWHWLTELVRGNLGYSFQTGGPVAERLGERLGPTLLLTGTAVATAYALSIPAGALAAVKQYSVLDYSVVATALLGISLPSFFVGLVGIYLFALRLGWLPVGGMSDVTAGGGGALDVVHHLILPASVLAFSVLGNTVRYVRSSMLDVIGQDYMRTARAKGLRERTVVVRHGLRNALVPVVTLAGLQFPFLLGGAVVTEQVFQWPGMGLLTVEAIRARDYPTLMGLTLISGVMVMLGNLLADLAYAWVDPRIRYD
ncbi:MAG TPA: ABC transporter permease [Bacillota bacterium]